MERRLAASLAADVVGYSRLMGDDEAGTLVALQNHREELIEPKAAQYRGRTVKLMGDGVLMEFASVVDAVTFAVEVQIAMRQRNSAVAEDRQIVFRKPCIFQRTFSCASAAPLRATAKPPARKIP